MVDWKTLYEKWGAVSGEMQEKIYVLMDKKAREKTEEFKKWLSEDSYREKIYAEKFSNTRRFISPNPPQALSSESEIGPTEKTTTKFPLSVLAEVVTRKDNLMTVSEASRNPVFSEGTVAVLPKVTALESVFKTTQPNPKKNVEETGETSFPLPIITKISHCTSKINPETPKTASLIPESLLEKHDVATVDPKFKAPTLSLEKPADTNITDKNEFPIAPSLKSEVNSGNRVVFLLKKPLTISAPNNKTVTNKIIFVIDNKETYAPKPENLTENLQTPAKETSFTALPTFNKTQLSPEITPQIFSEKTSPPLTKQEETIENPTQLSFEEPQPTSLKAEITPPTLETPPIAQTQSETLTQPISVPEEMNLITPKTTELFEKTQTQFQAIKQKQMFRLQLDTQTDIPQLLNRLNREKDLLIFINSQECWKCKSTEKTLVNYTVGSDKAEIKLTCKNCGATTTFNHENI
jgi:hypothetical protein